MGKVGRIIVMAAVAAAFAYAGGGFAAGSLLGSTFGTSAIAAAAVTFVGTAALGFVGQAFTPKPQTPSLGVDVNDRLRGGIQQIQAPVETWKIIYGEVRASGVVVFADSTGSNKYLHLVIVVASHEIDSFGFTIADSGPIYSDQLNGSGVVTSGKYANKMRIKYHTGAVDQVADSDLVSEITDWTSNHRLLGRAYVYLRLEHDQGLYNQGIPSFSFFLKGKQVLDTRDSTTKWLPNNPMCIRDYLVTPTSNGGMGFDATEDIDTTYFNSAANSCDEFVTTEDLAMTVSSVDTSADVVKFSDDTLKFIRGDKVQVSSTTSNPGGLTAATDYYAVPVKPYKNDVESLELAFATSYANALAGTTLDITSAGSGTITVTKKGEPRYTLNGILDTDTATGQNFEDMLRAMGGRASSIGSGWKIYAGVSTTPDYEFTEDDIVTPLKVRTQVPRRERFNRVKGTYISPINNSVPTDYPAIVNSTYETADGEVIIRDVDVLMTNRPHTAQRIAKIELERARQSITLEGTFKITAFRVQPGDVIQLTYSRFGWSQKEFEVTKWTFKVITINEAPAYVVDMSLQEYAAANFTWTSSEETLVDPAPNTNLPIPFPAGAPSALVLTSGTSVLDLREDGTIFSRIKLAWTAPTDYFVLNGGRIEIQYKKSANSTWIDGTETPGDQTEQFILDVQDGVAYDVRIRGRNAIGSVSSYVTETDHTVIGKTAPPSNVASLSVQQNAAIVTFKWEQVSDGDLAGYEIRYMVTPFVWEDATHLTEVTRGTQITTAAVPPSPLVDGSQVPWVFGIKAVDTSENESAAATTRSLTVINAFDVIETVEQWPVWGGLPTELKYLAVSHAGSPYLTVLDSNDWSVVGGTPTIAGVGQNLAWSPDKKYLAVCHGTSPYLTILNTSDWSVVPGTPTNLSGAGRVPSWSPDGNYLVIPYQLSPYLAVLDVRDWSVVTGTPTLPGIGRDSAWSPDGQYLAVTNTNTSPYLTIIKVSDWSTVSDTPVLAGEDGYMEFSRDGLYLAVSHEGSPYLTVIDTSDWSEVSTAITALAGIGRGVAWAPDRSYMAVVHDTTPYITIISTTNSNPGSWAKLSGPSLPTLGNSGRSVEFSPDGRYIAAGYITTSPYLTVIKTSDWSTVSGITALAGHGTGVAWAPYNPYFRNPLTGNLNINDPVLADQPNDTVFDIYAQVFVNDPIYETPEIDLGQDGTARVWADIQGFLGAGETGQADLDFSLDYKTAAGEYDGFQAWAVGTVTGRYYKGRVSQDATDGAAVLKRMSITIDSQERTEEFTNQTIAALGTTINFTTTFFNTPVVEIDNQTASALIPGYEDLTTSSVKIHLYNTSGTSVGGTAKIVVRGV